MTAKEYHDYKNTPTFIMGRLEVFRKDFPKQLNFKDAKDLAWDLRGGWRLPTVKEALYFIPISDLDIVKFNKDGNHARRGVLDI